MPQPVNPQDWDRYAYTRNNPVRYTDPTGHCYKMVGTQLATECQNRWQEYTKTIKSLQSFFFFDSLATLNSIKEKLGHEATTEEILRMTASAEYFIYADYPGVRQFGQEALARNFYEKCGQDGCQDYEIFKFLSGFSPWWLKRYSPEHRAVDLLQALQNEFYGTGKYLDEDIDKILNINNAIKYGWINGWEANQPWQWYGPFSHPGKDATGIFTISVFAGDGQFFWMFTGAQDQVFAPWRDN